MVGDDHAMGVKAEVLRHYVRYDFDAPRPLASNS
jgi:hypothetical protein